MYPPHGGSGVTSLLANGRNAVSATNKSGVESAVHSVRFDHNGDPV